MEKNNKEYVALEPGSKENYVCACGNDVYREGFETCDKNGKMIEPTTEAGWESHLLCACGGIFDQGTLKIVGKLTG